MDRFDGWFYQFIRKKSVGSRLNKISNINFNSGETLLVYCLALVINTL